MQKNQTSQFWFYVQWKNPHEATTSRCGDICQKPFRKNSKRTVVLQINKNVLQFLLISAHGRIPCNLESKHRVRLAVHQGAGGIFSPTHETAPLFLYKHVILATYSYFQYFHEELPYKDIFPNPHNTSSSPQVYPYSLTSSIAGNWKGIRKNCIPYQSPNSMKKLYYSRL